MLGQQNLVERVGFEPTASETRGLQPRRDTGFPIRTIVCLVFDKGTNGESPSKEPYLSRRIAFRTVRSKLRLHQIFLEVLPGVEPESQHSKCCAIAVTPQDHWLGWQESNLQCITALESKASEVTSFSTSQLYRSE